MKESDVSAAIEGAYIEWWKNPLCRRAGPCATADCSTAKKKNPGMCQLFRSYVAKRIVEQNAQIEHKTLPDNT